MAKLTQDQKEQASLIAEIFSDEQMRVFFCRESRIMVGIMPHNPDMHNPNTYRVFVTQCHEQDKFKKKLGLIELCNKYENDNYVLYRSDAPIDDIATNFIEFFSFDGWAHDMQEIDLAYI